LRPASRRSSGVAEQYHNLRSAISQIQQTMIAPVKRTLTQRR
jgi:hypothetical protein